MANPTIVIPDNVGPQTSNAGDGRAHVPGTKVEPKDTEPTKQEPTKSEIRKMKLKIEGVEAEYDEAEVVKWAQEGKLSTKRFQEAAEIKKQAEALIAKAKNPEQLAELFQELGIDVDSWSEQRVWQKIQESELTPEQKKQRDVEAELKKYRDKDAKDKADAESAQDKALQEHYEVDFEKKIISALDLGGLPTKGKAGREVVRRMANYMLVAAQNNLDLNPSDLVSQVRRDLNEEHRAMYDDAPDDLLSELLGPAGKRLREADVKKLKTTQQQAFSKPTSAARQAADDKPKKLSGSDWREALKKDFLK